MKTEYELKENKIRARQYSVRSQRSHQKCRDHHRGKTRKLKYWGRGRRVTGRRDGRTNSSVMRENKAREQPKTIQVKLRKKIQKEA